MTTAADPTERARRVVLLADGLFLAAIGAVQLFLELLAHYGNAGPYASIFAGSPYTLGWFEAHGFAVLVGSLFLTVAARDPRPLWHPFGLAVHALLGGANVLFWTSFTAFDAIAIGILATTAHVLFVVAHAACSTASCWRPRELLDLRSGGPLSVGGQRQVLDRVLQPEPALVDQREHAMPHRRQPPRLPGQAPGLRVRSVPPRAMPVPATRHPEGQPGPSAPGVHRV
jgi:hypothetical protein